MLVGRPSSGYSEGFLLGFQVGRCRSGVRVADGGDQVFAGERVQRFQPVHRYQHERGLRGDLRHHSGGAGAIFAGPVTQLAQSEECSREEMLARLKDMYDGYHFSKRMTDIYNPYSLLRAFNDQDLGSFWFSTGNPTYLIRLLSHSQEGLDRLVGRYYAPQEFVDYRATVEKPIPMIYQSGYLTIKKYDAEFGTFQLDFPNKEVARSFVSLVANLSIKPSAEPNEV